MRNIVIIAAAAALIALTAAASAQTDTAAPPAPAGATTGATAGANAAASGMRQQCEEALLADAQWRAELKKQLAAEVHEQDAQLMLTNKKHVVMAYAALWVLVVGFVAFMWMKQRALKAEIARLESEIREAVKES